MNVQAASNAIIPYQSATEVIGQSLETYTKQTIMHSLNACGVINDIAGIILSYLIDDIRNTRIRMILLSLPECWYTRTYAFHEPMHALQQVRNTDQARYELKVLLEKQTFLDLSQITLTSMAHFWIGRHAKRLERVILTGRKKDAVYAFYYSQAVLSVKVCFYKPLFGRVRSVQYNKQQFPLDRLETVQSEFQGSLIKVASEVEYTLTDEDAERVAFSIAPDKLYAVIQRYKDRLNFNTFVFAGKNRLTACPSF
jgi:hypothetical protein